MSASFTPGPWNVRTLENFGFNIVRYVDGDRFNIQRVAKAGDEADARLIAAAPDLVEALRFAEVALLGVTPPTMAGADIALNKVRTALRKALGEGEAK